jgi:hypothetical protein
LKRTTENFFFKTQRQLCAQREENAHTNSNVSKRYKQIPDQNIDQGASTPPKQYCPLNREETEECVELLDILGIEIQKRYY